MYPGRHARERADQAAFIMASTGESVSYAEYDEAELGTYEPIVVHVDRDNRIVDVNAAPEELLT